MSLGKRHNNESIIYAISLSRDELRWMANSMNEVLHGIHNVNIEESLTVTKDIARKIHKKLADEYKSADSHTYNILMSKQALIVVRKAMFVVMHDFNKYNEYGTRLGVEFNEYLDLLDKVIAIFEK
jgi:hypothetical protein